MITVGMVKFGQCRQASTHEARTAVTRVDPPFGTLEGRPFGGA